MAEDQRPLVIYHTQCPDGFTAAWAACFALGECDLWPALFNSVPPVVTGRDVYIVDFAYSREVLIKMHDEAKTLRVLDHHKTAQEALTGLDWCTFDMERSGAGIVWDELVKRPRPWLIDYIEDRDLWRHALPDSKAVNAYIMAQPYTLRVWNDMHGTGLYQARTMGEAILMKIRSYVEQMRVQAFKVKFEGVDAMLVNAPFVMISDLLNALLSEETPMAIGWAQRADGRYQYGLRSRGEVDVGEIARRYGGGGHKHAAGFDVGERPRDLLGDTMPV